MNPANRLHALGQSLWLDNITRTLVQDGTLARYIREIAVTGLTSNPTIFEQAIKNGSVYDEAIRTKAAAGLSDEALFFELAIEDLSAAADLFAPEFERTNGVDGWVSLEVSPLLADETEATVNAAVDLHARAAKPNLYIKIPGTPAGIPAIEEAIAAGVPVNVTLLFSAEQYLAAAEAWARGIERRLEAGLPANVSSVASVFVSRWDAAVKAQLPNTLHNRLGVAMMGRCYREYRKLLISPRWQKLISAGVSPQRLLFASTSAKDPALGDSYYVDALAAPDTVNTIPEKTLLAYVDSGNPGPLLPPTGGDCETVLASIAAAGVDIDALATKLQRDGAASFVKSWQDLIACLAEKSQKKPG
ncbi:transaldolase [uncultured Nevskia sp.]|uniref:transaldolase n=1 Tax=uncultured Nevskia sp. TaxID=228950 RepID=UPI0025F2851C|nr:transaldolase [uncultured Nevskia sp.]